MDILNNVIKASSGDQSAINELYYATYPKLRAITVSILKNEADAEDIIQDSYIFAFSNLNRLDNAQKFEPWICRIATNKCKDYLKKHKPALFSEQTAEDAEPFEWSIEDQSTEYRPEDVLVSNDTRNQIMELLNSLPDEQRICLVCFAVEGMKISEIAAMFGVSENTVKSRLSYAKAKMQQKINDLEAKKGISLRSFILFPFIKNLFGTATVTHIPPLAIGGAATFAAEAGAAVAKSTAFASTSATTGNAVAGAVTKAAASTAGKAAIKCLGLKIAAAVVAGAIAVTTITVGIVHVINNNSDDNETTSSKQSTTDSKPEPTQKPDDKIEVEEQEKPDTYVNTVDSLSADELERLNTYLSNFSEQRFKEFPTTDEQLYYFAYSFDKINNPHRIGNSGDGYYTIEKSRVNATLKRFFDTSIGEFSSQDVTLKDGLYYIPAADGATHPYFSVASKLYQEGDKYIVVFDNYEVSAERINGHGSFPREVYKLNSDEAKADDTLEYQSTGSAILKIGSDGKYVIATYSSTTEIFNKEPTDQDKTITDDEAIEIPVDFEALKAVNPDVCAWIEIDGIDGIDYPILQSSANTDTDYYLSHDIDGKESASGELYIQKLNSKDFSDSNTVIYGNNMLNGSRFGLFKRFRDKDFFDANRYIYIYTPEKVFKYEIISAFVYDNRHLINAVEQQDFFDDCINPSSTTKQVLDGASLSINDKIVTLCTFTANESERYLVVGKLIETVNIK